MSKDMAVVMNRQTITAIMSVKEMEDKINANKAQFNKLYFRRNGLIKSRDKKVVVAPLRRLHYPRTYSIPVEGERPSHIRVVSLIRIGDVLFGVPEGGVNIVDLSKAKAVSIRGEMVQTMLSHLSGTISLRYLVGIKDPVSFTMKDGQPMVRHKKTVKKAGKFLRGVLPKHIKDKVIQDAARILDANNPAVAREKELMEPTIIPGLAGANQSDHSLGSCMYGKKSWANLDKFFNLKETSVEDLSQPPSEDAGPVTILWSPTSREVHGGCGQLRCFCWPVITDDGERKWYMDRVYPSSNHSRDWVNDFCAAVGIELNNSAQYSHTGSGVYNDRAKAQPSAMVKLKYALWPHMMYLKSISLPWLDTFANLSRDGKYLLTPQKAKKMEPEDRMDSHALTTGGRWHGRDSFRCKCGELSSNIPSSGIEAVCETCE